MDITGSVQDQDIAVVNAGYGYHRDQCRISIPYRSVQGKDSTVVNAESGYHSDQCKIRISQ